MIRWQNTNSTTMREVLAEQVDQIGKRLETLEALLDQLNEESEPPGEMQTRVRTVEELREIGLTVFRELLPNRINQILHHLFGSLRLKVLDGQIVGFCSAPKRGAPNQARKPTDT